MTSNAPTAELMGPKKGNAMAKNQIGKMTGIRHMARNKTCLVWWIPNNFSHTKYSGVTANPTVMNCTPPINQHMHTLTHVKIHLIIPFTTFNTISYHSCHHTIHTISSTHTTYLITPSISNIKKVGVMPSFVSSTRQKA